MGFEWRFECGKFRAVADVFGQRAPEGGGSYVEGSITPGPALGSKCWREEVCSVYSYKVNITQSDLGDTWSLRILVAIDHY